MNDEDKPVDPHLMVAAEVPQPKNKGGRPRKNPAPTPVEVSAAPTEESLLTAAEIKALQDEAREEALEELRSAARKKIKTKFFREERARLSPQSGEEMVKFRLEMPSYAYQWPIIIDGVYYFHGKEYEVPRSKYDGFAEMVYRAHEHQRVIDGKSVAEDARRHYREQLPGGRLSGKVAA